MNGQLSVFTSVVFNFVAQIDIITNKNNSIHFLPFLLFSSIFWDFILLLFHFIFFVLVPLLLLFSFFFLVKIVWWVHPSGLSPCGKLSHKFPIRTRKKKNRNEVDNLRSTNRGQFLGSSGVVPNRCYGDHKCFLSILEQLS